MAVQLTIEFEMLLGLVNQLKPSEKQVLLRHLQEKINQEMPNDEVITPEDSMRREDLYGDDGR